MFTVVIPLFNKERHIERAVRSVINQTFQDFEIIVVDDGSTDNSVEEVLKIKDNRIKLIKQKNGGVSSARNKGIDESRFEYIAFLDADDAWKPNFLESINGVIEQYPKAGAYCTSYDIKREDLESNLSILGIDHRIRSEALDLLSLAKIYKLIFEAPK